MSESLALIIGLVLTLFIYSYLVGDNPLFRLAVHLMVGVSAGYALVIAIRRIFIPVFTGILSEPTSPETALWLIPIGLSLLLLFKWVGPMNWVGNMSLGILVTIGASAALFGAVAGTLIPQLLSFETEGPIFAILVALLTACSLLYFQFTAKVDPEGVEEQAFRQRGWTALPAAIGQIVLMITFGAVFAGVFTTSLVLLIERIDYFMTGLTSLLGIILL